MKGDEKGDEDRLAAASEDSFRKDEGDVNQKYPEYKRDQTAGQFHVGYDKMEKPYEKGVEGGENIAEGLTEKTPHELFGHRRVAYPVHFNGRSAQEDEKAERQARAEGDKKADSLRGVRRFQ